MAESQFQDIVRLSSQSLNISGQAVVVGSDAGAKSVILSNNVGALHLNATPTAVRSQQFADANGTVGLITAISAGTTLGSNGQVVFSNSPTVTFGMNGNTVTASVSPTGGAAVAISAGTQLATSGTVVFTNSNGFTFGMSGSSVVSATYEVGWAEVMAMIGV